MPYLLDEQPILLSALPPTRGEERLALSAALAMAVGFLVSILFADVRLPESDVFIPIAATIVFVNDLITAVLLFAQFSLVGTSALLVLACGYLINSLLMIPYVLTQPGAFSRSGLLGAGLQTTSWLFVFWNVIPTAALIVYVALKDTVPARGQTLAAPRQAIVKSAAVVVAIVCGLTWLVTAHENLLPAMLEPDEMRITPAARLVITPFMMLLNAAAFGLLWKRRRSLLDLWLLLVSWSWLLRSILQIDVDARFSLSWYAVRFFWALSSTLLLVALVSEGTLLYVRFAMAVAARQRESDSRLVTMDAVAASIAHEIKQPLGAIVTNAAAALELLKGARPDINEASDALKDIVDAGNRADNVINSIRAIFRRERGGRRPLDLNDLVRDTLSLVRRELQIQSVSLDLNLAEGLPHVVADRMQLQQAFLNIFVNAIEAMNPVTDRPHSLSVKSARFDTHGVLISITDSGIGIDPTHANRIFDPFFTTKSRGTGIGLSLCQSVIQDHGGRIWSSPAEPQGTVFNIRLTNAARTQDSE
jgi:signal transduction histidine kinase